MKAIAEELRLNNWVSFLCKDEITKEYELSYIQVDPYILNVIKIGSKKPSEQYMFVPLTEDWLLRFGFEKVEDLGDIIYYQIRNKRRGFGVELNHDEWVFYLYNNIDYTPLIYDEPHFKYVHHLQNLCMDLEGNELTITNL